VETASRLFYTQGYNSTGINQVIKEAEVAKASLYQHFPSKEELLIEYLKLTSVTTTRVLQSVADKHKTPRKKILALFDFLSELTKETGFQGCNFLNVVSEIPNNNKKVRGLIQKQKDQIRSLFARLLKPLDKEDLADELYVLFDAALISSKVYGELWPVKTCRKIAEKLV
jgi:AcrR family transcriptional regulator